MDKKEVRARVEAKIAGGDFFFAEDLMRGIADAMDIDLAGTPLGQDAPADSRTRGSVPPFSGVPATPEAATEDTEKNVAKFEELQAKRAENNPTTFGARITRADLGIDENDGLETEVKTEGPIYPDDESTSTDSKSDTKTTTVKGETKK